MEERLKAVEKDIEGIKGNVLVIERRLTTHGNQIDSLEDTTKDFKLDLELIKQSTRYAEQNTKEIKDTLKELTQRQDKDHYITPLENNRKVLWQVVTLVLAFIVGLLLKTLFPNF